MSQSVIDVVVRTRGQRELDRLQTEMRRLEGEVARLQGRLPATANGIRQTGRAAATATGNIQRMGVAFRTTLGPIVATYGAVNFLTRSLRIAGDRQADVAVLTNGLEKLGESTAKVEELVDAADRLGNVTLFSQDDFTQAFGLLTSFRGIAVSSYERVAEAAADVAQVTRQDVSSSMLQLAKALENPVEGMTALSRSGTTFTKQQKELVKQLVETNRTAEAQEFILSEVEKQYKGAAVAAGKAGFAGQVDELGESFTDLSEIIGKTFAPVLANIIKDITDMVNTFVKGLQAMEQAYKGFMQRLRSTSVSGLTRDIEGINERIANQQRQLSLVNEAGPGGVRQAEGYRNTIAQLRQLRGELQDDLAQLQGFETFTPEPITFQAATGATEQQVSTQRQLAGAARDSSNALKEEAEQVDYLGQTFNGLTATLESFSGWRWEEILGGPAEIAEIDASLQGLADGIGNSFGGLFTDLVEGTKSAGEAFRDFFNSIVDTLISNAARMISEYIAIGIARQFAGLAAGPASGSFGVDSGSLGSFGGGPFGSFPGLAIGGSFAEGGEPPVGVPSLVGERGPELFVPGQQGLVVPNDIFDATRQALTSGGGTDQAFSENSEALAVASSYTRERMFERERQTMLTGAGGSTTVQTQVINNVEYATIDQVQEVANLSAKRARAQVFADLKNKPSARSAVGMR